MADYYVWGGSVPSDIITAARTLVTSPVCSYILARTGAQEYTCIVADSIDSSTLICSGCIVYRWYADNTGSYGWHFSTYSADTVSVENSSNYLIYSSLQQYPSIVERGDIYVQAVLVCLCCGFLLALLQRIFWHVS